MCKEEFAQIIDKSVFRGSRGDPHMNTISAIAVIKEKLSRIQDIRRTGSEKRKVLAQTLMDAGIKLVTNGTDNHMMVTDTIKSFNMDAQISGKDSRQVAITVNKQVIPDDPNPSIATKRIRNRSTGRDNKRHERRGNAKTRKLDFEALKNHTNEEKLSEIKAQVKALCYGFPVPGFKTS